ncbi:hypothetical protein H5410_061818 [Solanum commersonii]|uniref:Uncharacterized protein n=1 Tax=Solanum commersonii TaxID=4109 RepID=A0A9J5W9X1_SOLCO|nr:hypothetical protein H5410_061818 [Solanum commersonii]
MDRAVKIEMGWIWVSTNGLGKQWKKLNGEEVKQLWKNVFTTNRLETRGMNLNYITPVIVDEEKVVEIFPEDVAQDNEK